MALFVASIAVALALVLNAEAGLSLLARLIAIGLLVRGLLLVTRAIVAGSPGRAPDAY